MRVVWEGGWRGGATMNKSLILPAIFVVLGVALQGSDSKTPTAPKEGRLAELLALPTEEFRADPYIRAAETLQTMGKAKACALLRELAPKDDWPHTRTLTLCRMLSRPSQSVDVSCIGRVVCPEGLVPLGFSAVGPRRNSWKNLQTGAAASQPFRYATRHGHHRDAETVGA